MQRSTTYIHIPLSTIRREAWCMYRTYVCSYSAYVVIYWMWYYSWTKLHALSTIEKVSCPLFSDSWKQMELSVRFDSRSAYTGVIRYIHWSQYAFLVFGVGISILGIWFWFLVFVDNNGRLPCSILHTLFHGADGRLTTGTKKTSFDGVVCITGNTLLELKPVSLNLGLERSGLEYLKFELDTWDLGLRFFYVWVLRLKFVNAICFLR